MLLFFLFVNCYVLRAVRILFGWEGLFLFLEGPRRCCDYFPAPRAMRQSQQPVRLKTTTRILEFDPECSLENVLESRIQSTCILKKKSNKYIYKLYFLLLPLIVIIFKRKKLLLFLLIVIYEHEIKHRSEKSFSFYSWFSKS